MNKSTMKNPQVSETLAYAIVRLAEAFLYNDAAAALEGQVDGLRAVEAALLGLTPTRADTEG